MLGRGPGAVLLLMLSTACGSSSSASGGAAAAGGDAGGDAGVGAGGGSGGSLGPDAAGADAPVANPWPDSGTIDAGVFDCDGVCCDGTTHYCHIDYAGASPVFGSTADAALSCSDAGSTQCTPLPTECLGAPSCACVGAHETNYFPAGCSCDDQGGGITVKCYYP